MSKRNQAGDTAKLLAAVGGVNGQEAGGTGVAEDAVIAGASDGVAGGAANGEAGSQEGVKTEGLTPTIGVDAPGVSAALGELSDRVDAAIRAQVGVTGGAAGESASTLPGTSGGSLNGIYPAGVPVQDVPAVVKRIQARVLVDGRYGRINAVVTVTEDELEASAGELCAHPASVAYAKSL